MLHAEILAEISMCTKDLRINRVAGQYWYPSICIETAIPNHATNTSAATGELLANNSFGKWFAERRITA